MGKYSDDLSRRLRSKEDEEGMTMDEAAPRTWATGAIKIAANDRDCFDWSGTRAQAIEPTGSVSMPTRMPSARPVI
jgi:hypothetical protein